MDYVSQGKKTVVSRFTHLEKTFYEQLESKIQIDNRNFGTIKHVTCMNSLNEIYF